MQTIASTNNMRVKRWQRLTKASGYREEGIAWCEGIHLLQSLLDSGLAPLEVIVSEQAWKHPEVVALRLRLPEKNIFLLQEKVAEKLFLLEAGTRIACTVVCLQLPIAPGSCVILDGIQDAGNVGSILRTAAAAHCGAAIFRQGCAAAWSPKVMRAAMGAHWQLPILDGLPLPECLDFIERTGLPLIATSQHGGLSLYKTNLQEPVIWLLGNEGSGVSQALLAQATKVVRIPQNPRIESINVAACAAILLFEGVRQQSIPKI